MSKSTDVTKASVKIAISSRDEEDKLVREFKKEGIISTGVDIGGNLLNSIPKIIERALVAAKRTGVISDCHVHEGAVIGATRETINQVSEKATGFNVGGKIGIARSGEHISICLFLSIGVLHLDDIVIGLAHRSIPDNC
ncbi:HutP protein [Peptoclostridium litorale DSM 5388]|uniref:Hut operon positive regulatory protein n=1 Tax=Peptoclostridium litorale DSM 5388 TaxID=1121324 RepID=A0A069RK91_PEPLI|nr:HutP family protein [Peptoclostridium litorale]KDR94607.1 HutP superfamily protein [Peptoclostridium litorale DSM 5388]SIO32056.1 HutP protein [Peptoclostridium litorale DSM 5388]